MYPIACVNTHHDVITSKVYAMMKNKRWLFCDNKRFLKCVFKSKFSEVSFSGGNLLKTPECSFGTLISNSSTFCFWSFVFGVDHKDVFVYRGNTSIVVAVLKKALLLRFTLNWLRGFTIWHSKPVTSKITMPFSSTPWLFHMFFS